MHILVVEDDLRTADYLKKGLLANGFVVDVAHNGRDGLFMGTHYAFDLVILDVMLPVQDGFAVLKALREVNPSVHVILLTARDAIEDRVRGLELGADDYLLKPFSFAELLARIRSALRRSQTAQREILQAGDLSIDLPRHRAERAGVRLDLTPREFALLSLLVQRTGEVLSRTLIAEHVWDIHFDSDTNVVDVAIRRLRQKADDPFPNKLIHTVRGMGYVLEPRENA